MTSRTAVQGWLALYIIVLVLSQCLLASPGRRVPVYAALAAIAGVSMLSDVRRMRLIGLAGVLLAVALVLLDFYAGVKFDKSVHLIQTGLGGEK